MSLSRKVIQLGPIPRPGMYTKGLMYGIELEYENWNGTPLNTKRWSMTSDGSLRNGGVELVSIPTAAESLRETLDEAAVLIRKGGCRATPRCGIHTHLNMKHLTAGQMFSFITAYVLLEPAVFQQFPERKTSSFCVPVYLSGFTTRHIYQAVQATRTSETSRPITFLNNNSKYAALNTGSLGRFGTLEFRQMPATTRMSAVIKWLETLTRIHDMATQHDDPINIVELYEGMGDRAFIESFLNHEVKVENRDQRLAYIAAVQTAGYPEPSWEDLQWNAPIT